MQRIEAIKKLKRVLGPKAYWRIGPTLTSPERRHAAALIMLDALFQKAMLDRDMQIRRDALLQDPEYQSLRTARAGAVKVIESPTVRQTYRFEVGVTANIVGFETVKPRAYGDTWEEIFSKLKGASA